MSDILKSVIKTAKLRKKNNMPWTEMTEEVESGCRGNSDGRGIKERADICYLSKRLRLQGVICNYLV